MFGSIIGAVVSGFLKPFLVFMSDKARYAARVQEISISAAESVREAKLGHLLGRLPLFMAEASAAAYFSAVMIDSTWPSDWLNPLRLPIEFQSYYNLALASIFGLATFERIMRK